MPSTDHSPARRRNRYAAVGFGVPALALIVGLVVGGLTLTDLPDEIAVHWSVAGGADGWAPPWTMLIGVVAACAVSAALAAANYRLLRDEAPGGAFRWLSTTSAVLSTALTVVFVGVLVSQTDGDEASPTVVIGVAAVAAIVVGVLAWAVQPADLPADPGRRAEPMGLAPGGRAVWLHTQTTGRAVAIIVGLVLVFSVATAIMTWLTGSGASAMWAAIVIVVIATAATATVFAFHIRIDPTGLTVRSIAGLPRWHVPAADIDDVTVIDVRALGDFGGYGVRHARGRFGIILRSGPAVAITRSSGKQFVVTVDDAPTAAALLAAVALRADPSR